MGPDGQAQGMNVHPDWHPPLEIPHPTDNDQGPEPQPPQWHGAGLAPLPKSLPSSPPRQFKDRRPPPPSSHGPLLLKTGSHNLNKQSPEQFILADLDAGYDVVCYQEINRCPDLQLACAQQKPPPKVFTSIAMAGAEGVTMVISPRFSPYAFSLHSPCQGALCLTELHLQGHPAIPLGCVYAQPPRRSEPEKALDKLFEKYPYYVLGGDFNAQLSLPGSIGVTRNNWSWLTALVHDRHRAVDTSGAKHRKVSAFTRYKSPLLACCTRIDLILVSTPLASMDSFKLKTADMCSQDKSSDHNSIYCHF